MNDYRPYVKAETTLNHVISETNADHIGETTLNHVITETNADHLLYRKQL